ncbi:MAG: type II toxin-antitoxin system HicB family antitoxin [Oscillospiraceae bacterium]|jgi:predicted RNase H-like HicB family nuclease|nr:type II toxin-antitoxin system HicB family antitoxin [Oscillospiraceae bacterium]
MGEGMRAYAAIFDYAEDGISVEFPDLPGCLTCAESDDEALLNAEEALRGWLAVSDESGVHAPEPTPLENISLSGRQRAVLVTAHTVTRRSLSAAVY